MSCIEFLPGELNMYKSVYCRKYLEIMRRFRIVINGSIIIIIINVEHSYTCMYMMMCCSEELCIVVTWFVL